MRLIATIENPRVIRRILPISDSRLTVPIPAPPGPLLPAPETSSPTSLPERAARPAPRPGAAAPTLVAPRPKASASPRVATCSSRSPAFRLGVFGPARPQLSNISSKREDFVKFPLTATR